MSASHDEAEAPRPREKERSTIAANAALVGLSVWPVDGGGWIVSRWGLWRQVDSDDEVWALIRAIGGRHG